VLDGAAWVNGEYCALTAQTALPATANGLVVVRYTAAGSTAELLYLDAATVPTQTDALFELVVAQVTAGVLADMRGLVTPPGVVRFVSMAARDINLPDPPDGLTCSGPLGCDWERIAGAWQLTSRWARYYEEEYARGSYADTGFQWFFDDLAVYPVPTIATITANVFTTGWTVGFVPTVDIYSNSVPSPWVAGFGMSYTAAKGQPFQGAEIAPAGNPQQLPSLSAVEDVPAGAPMQWTVRLTINGGAGAINWHGGYHVVVERRPKY
jgi:hypothetical protein